MKKVFVILIIVFLLTALGYLGLSILCAISIPWLGIAGTQTGG